MPFVHIQRQLSVWQALPVVGPIVVSPIKAAFSLVQILAGFVASVFLAVIAVLCMNKTTEKYLCDACSLTFVGMLALGYSLVNIFTLGIAGCQAEHAGCSGRY